MVDIPRIIVCTIHKDRIFGECPKCEADAKAIADARREGEIAGLEFARDGWLEIVNGGNGSAIALTESIDERIAELKQEAHP